MGVHGDVPFEKFFLKNQPKIHSSNYELSLGTTKPTNFIPGYAGFIPVNKFTVYNDRVKDWMRWGNPVFYFVMISNDS